MVQTGLMRGGSLTSVQNDAKRNGHVPGIDSQQ